LAARSLSSVGRQFQSPKTGRICAKYILQKFPRGTIAAMWQDQRKELRDGLGDQADMIVADAPFEVSDPTVD
jgi:branched-chain amino acid transport system substrate-binding protein